MKLRLKIEKFFAEQLWQLLIVVAFVIFCGWIFYKPIQAAMFCVAHFIIRKNFEKQYHCGTIGVCLFTTLSIAFFGIMTVLPFAVSLLSTVPVCFLICWVGYIAQDRIDLVIANNKLKEGLEKDSEFSTDNCTEESLIARCKEIGLSQDNILLAIEFFVKKTKHSKIAASLCVNEASVTRRKYRLREKLNKTSKD